MKVWDVVRRRRSIRRYAGKIPEKEKIKKVLEAAIWAPSGLNNQPWKFKIIKDKKVKDHLAVFTECGDVIKIAPLLICVFLDRRAVYNREKDIMAIGASIQNIMLMACEEGLGTCWLGEILNRKKEVEKYLGTGPDFELMACLTLGYPKGKSAKGSRRRLKSFILNKNK